MIRTHLMMTIAILTVVLTTQARADFRLEAYPEASASRRTQDLEEGGPKPVLSALKVAHGFGDDVPLSFAARQIVPPTLTVRYGRGVDPNAAVSWKGEAPWNRVLAAAVRPLRLRLTTGKDSVLISR